MSDSRWYLYDELLDTVPATALVRRITCGEHWLMVESDQGGIGMAHYFQPPLGTTTAELERRRDIAGRPLREIASRVKDWDFHNAAIGLAALNAANNTMDVGKEARLRDAADRDRGDAFDFFLPRTKGKKVAVIGHFPYLKTLREQSELSILERMPQAGVLPDSAAEYILPEQDFVYITGTTLINKTITRLLELSRQAIVCLVGPSTPMHPLLFKRGLASLSGLLVSDYDGMAEAIAGDSCVGVFARHGVKVNMVDEAAR